MRKWSETHYLRTALVLLIILALAYALWWFFGRPKADIRVATEAPNAGALRRAEQIDTPLPAGKVRTFKPAIKEKLKLPPAVIADPQKQVTDATTVKPTERPTTVTSVIDTKTGETTLFSKPEPYPWLAVESRGEARFDYGYKLTKGNVVPMPVGRLSVTHNFIQVKALHAGVNVAIDTDGQAFAGVGLSYRW